MDQKTKRAGNITAEQKEVMVEFLKKHPNLLKGKFSPAFSKATAQSLWQQLERILNAMVGAKKEWYQWRKSWQDLRSNVKTKKAPITKHRMGTGGGEPTAEELTPMEEGVIEIIGTTAIEGHPIEESSVSFALSSASSDNDEKNYQENVNQTDDHIQTSVISSQKISPLQQRTGTAKFAFKLNPKKLLNRVGQENDVNQTDHNYTTRVMPSQKISPLQRKTALKSTPKKPTHLGRLDRTIAATDTLAEQNSERIDIMRQYYEKKIDLMQEDVDVKRDIADSLRTICEHLNNQ